MLRRLALRDFVIVPTLELEFEAGFSVLTGETGAGKSILIDALQLALGSRGDAGVVREGAARAEISAEFDTPMSLRPWLDEAGFEVDTELLLLRRAIDAQGKSRAWINGSAATIAQLREAADHLLDIHGQHAWQSLTRPAAVRELLDTQAGIDPRTLQAAWSSWRGAQATLDAARAKQDEHSRERERLAWQVGEIDKLAPGDAEWDELNAEHQRVAHSQSLIDGVRQALGALSDGDDEHAARGAGRANGGADMLTSRALDALLAVRDYDTRLVPAIEVLQGALAQIEDATHTLGAYLSHADVDPRRLADLDARLSAWVGLARRLRRPPAELPAMRTKWQAELAALEVLGDLAALEASVANAEQAYRLEANRVSAARAAAAPKIADAVTQAMQQLGMQGGRFEVALLAQATPQSFGLETVELLVAGHEGSTPRPLAKVASGGELSRLALAISVSTAAGPLRREAASAGTLIFDEIDAGIGGGVADTVGRLMKRLGAGRQVLAVTHLAQVAACGDHHFVVSKATNAGVTASAVQPVTGEARVSEIARMLGGERLADTSRAHAVQLLAQAGEPSKEGTPASRPAAARARKSKA